MMNDSVKILNCSHRQLQRNSNTIITDVVETFLCRSRARRWPLSLRASNVSGAFDIRIVWDDLSARQLFQVWARDDRLITMMDSRQSAINLMFELLHDTDCYSISLLNADCPIQPRVHLENTRRDASNIAHELLTIAMSSICIH
uniref:Uncharacterized protein n=1 Tax=Spongospora subterranea TaxID=70186 RepID=A0A0H5RJ59_9EUKA|eukprot:CRZ08739.1 hypothetical protein [Spongospora subterranea]